MPRMSEETAQAVMYLGTHSRFHVLMDHFKGIEDELQIQINDPLTPKDEREVMVHLKQQLRNEVIDVTSMAIAVLKKKDEFLKGEVTPTER